MALTKRLATLDRRAFLRRAGIGATSALLAACAPKPAPAPTTPAQVESTKAPEPTAVPEPTAEPTLAPAAPVTLEVWWVNWAEVWNQAMVDLGKAYTAANPNVQMEWTFSPEWQQKLLARVAAGDAPDVTYTYYGAQAGLASKDTFLALDEYAAQAGITSTTFLPSMWAESLWDGKLYCIPGGADFIVFFYSKTTFKNAGLDPEAPPKTAAELVDCSAKILKYDSAGNVDVMGYGPETDHLMYWSFIFGGDWYDPGQKKITANHPKNVEALEWLVEQVKKVGADKLTAWMTGQPDAYTPGNPFATGRSAFLTTGYWMGQTIDELAPDLEYGITHWPTLNGTPEERKNYIVQGWMVAIPKGAENADAAWGFVKSAFVDNNWKESCDTVNGCTVLAQMEQFNKCVMDLKGPDNRMTPYFHVFGETGSAGTKYWPVVPVNQMLFDEMVRAYNAAINGQKTAQQALDETTEIVQKELDKALS